MRKLWRRLSSINSGSISGARWQAAGACRRPFIYSTFMVDLEQTRGQLIYALGDGQRDIPPLRLLVKTIIPERPRWMISRWGMISPMWAACDVAQCAQGLYDDSSSASILLLKARAVTSAEAKLQLRDAHSG